MLGCVIAISSASLQISFGPLACKMGVLGSTVHMSLISGYSGENAGQRLEVSF